MSPRAIFPLERNPMGFSAFHINIQENGVGNPCRASLINLIWIVIALVWLNQMATVTQWLQSRHSLYIT